MKNIVVCCDGTWNTPENMDHGLPAPTNVVKLYNALIKDAQQEVYYHPGVGTGRNWWDKIAGGGTGEGLDQNIKSAYRWVGAHYAAGDRIFLFGFSRGAYTARSLGGFIGKCGLLDLSRQMTPTEVWKRTDEIFAAYRKGVEFANPNGYAFHNTPAGQPAKETTPIHFIGVWDTVGALGIPDDLALLGLFDNPANYRFHNTGLSRMIAHARHAVALDERRESFLPTLWSECEPPTIMKQIWFPGVHCDVGGGYGETGLSDRALEWMIEEAEASACGLRFRSDIKRQLAPDPLGIVHDSCSGIFKALKTKPRPTPSIPSGQAILDVSTVIRNANPPLLQGDYWPTTTLPTGASQTFNVYAAEHWNRAGLYLEVGRTYKFAANGEWVDGKEPFSAAGHSTRGIHLRDAIHFAASAFGEAEVIFNTIMHRNADFLWTRRHEDAPWFALMGFVASLHGEDAHTLATGESFMIGESKTFTPELGGYLYCYANDAWQAYGNNRGSVELTVTRSA
jgi:T6SS, Phospholipase effector Tle1-like, catalytic domain